MWFERKCWKRQNDDDGEAEGVEMHLVYLTLERDCYDAEMPRK